MAKGRAKRKAARRKKKREAFGFADLAREERRAARTPLAEAEAKRARSLQDASPPPTDSTQLPKPK